MSSEKRSAKTKSQKAPSKPRGKPKRSAAEKPEPKPPPGPPSAAHAKAEAALAKAAMAYPETREDNPWGHRAFKVKEKVFMFLGADAEGIGLSLKLPQSCDAALAFPFAEPTGYGLGKSGWVSARFGPGEVVPLPLLVEWLDESFRAVAPKRVSATLPPR